MKNIIILIGLIFVSAVSNAQVIKFEVDTIQYFQMVKGKTVNENIDSNLIKYLGYGYGRADGWEIDLDEKTVYFGSIKHPITKVQKEGERIMVEYYDKFTFEKYFLLVDKDKNNKKFVMYLKDDNYGGGLSYIK
jgi:hypothetical protein